MSNEENFTSNPFDIDRDALQEQNTNAFSVDREVYDSSENPFALDREKPTKADILEKSRNSKLKALNNVSNMSSLSDSYTDMGDGWLESNANKIWNDMTGQEIQSLIYHAKKNYALSTDEEGNIVDPAGNIYGGRTRRLYDFGTKVHTRDEVKLGLARGDAESSRERYVKYPSGEIGADINRLNSEVLLPNDVAVMLEAAIHGRKGALEHRSVKDRYADPELTNYYGGGSSEYYTSREGALGAPAEIDEGLGKKLFQEYMDKLPDKYRKRGDKEVDRLGSLEDPMLNTLSGFAATFVNELGTKTLDAVGDLTGLYDLDVEGDAQRSVEKFFGYNPRAAEESIARIGQHWDVASDENASTSARVKAAGNGIIEALTTPEMLGTSLGAVLAWVSPGVLLKGIGVGSRYAQTASAIDKAVEAGQMTKMAGKGAKAKEFLSLDGAKSFLTSQSGFIASSLGNVNKQYEEFVQFNGGQELEGTEKAEWFAGRFTVQMLNQNLDKFVDFNVIKSPGVVKALVPAVKAMTNKEFSAAAGKMIKGIAKTAVNMGSEAAQEYTQTTMELFNARFGAETFKDLDTFTKFISDEDNIREGGIAALAGAGGSTQFEMLGAVSSIPAKVRSTLSGTVDESPESEVSANKVKAVSASMNTFASDNEETNPTAFFYAAHAGDVEETKTRANNYAANARDSILDGSNSVFHSDAPTTPNDVSRLVELAVASSPEVSYEEIKAAVTRGVQNKGETVSEEMKLAMDKANKAGKAFNRIKNMAQVSGEVSTGARGFITYYATAKAAEHVGDTAAVSASIKKLETFLDYETTKVKRLESGIEQVEGLVMAEAEALVSSGKAKDIHSALKIKGAEYKKRKKGGVVTTIKNSDKNNAKTTEISHYDVALSLRTQSSQQPFAGGIYNLVKTVNEEVKSMGEVLGSLLSPENVEQSAATPVQTSQESDIDTTLTSAQEELEAQRTKDYKLPEDIELWVDSNPDVPGTIKLKKAIAEGKMTPELEKSVFASVRRRIQKDKNKKAQSPVVAKAAESEQQTEDTVLESARESATDDGTVDESLYNDTQEKEESYTDILAGADGEFEHAEQFVDDGDYVLSSNEDFDYEDDGYLEALMADESTFVDDTSVVRRPKKEKHVKKEQEEEVSAFQNTQNNIKKLSTEINDRKDTIRASGGSVVEALESDSTLKGLIEHRDSLKETLNSFESSTRKHITERTEAITKKYRNSRIKLFTNYGKDEEPTYTLKDLFDNIKTTGFTVVPQTENDVHEATKAFGKNLEQAIKRVDVTQLKANENNLAGFLLYNVDGGMNYNTLQVMHTAVNDYVLRNSEELFGADRTKEKIAEVLGIHKAMVDERDEDALSRGGVTLRLASADIGKNILKNLGINPKTIPATDALATEIGIAALQGYADKDGSGIEMAVLTRTRNTYGGGTGIDLVVGNDMVLGKLSSMRDANKDVEERLTVNIDSSRSYRKGRKDKPRKVKQHRAEHLNAPKEHTDVVNRLENTPFVFNSGNSVLFELFGTDGKLDKEALIAKIIGPSDVRRNKDDDDSYKTQKAALLRSLDNYEKAHADMGSAELFFDWFIAKNHRIHLDSSGINPQGDKHIARWLITAAGASVDISKDLISEVVQGNLNTDYSNDVMVAKTFAYAIVQAFDGVDGIPGVDKDREEDILASANKLLDSSKYSDEELLEMAKDADHIGHAALAIANIRKFRNGDGTINSDMVLEVDGLTNGFAFRAMQYPVGNADKMQEWLEKVGVVQVKGSNIGTKSGKPIAELESMNAARSAGQEDVYISTGNVFGDKARTALSKLKTDVARSKFLKRKDKTVEAATKSEKAAVKKENQLKWITLFEEAGKLPDFGLTENDENYDALLQIIRNLMKSPTMIFGYAAGLKKISSSLVNDQIMGKGYLKGRGLVSFLTEVDPEPDEYGEYTYLVSEDTLKKTFGNELGTKYHNARVALNKKSLSYVGDANIVLLKKDLESAISELYAKPLEETLKELFAEQTRVNEVLVQAGEFLFQNFDIMYKRHLMNNPDIDEKGKMEWLKDYARFIPGIAGASSTDQRTKLMFLKNVLEKTGNSVTTRFNRKGGNKKLSTNTVTRGYGEPGVGPAVLTILSLDSSNLATSINEFYAENDYADVVPVHDAIVLGVGDYGVIKQYSKDFYLINKRYSIVEEFQKSVSSLSRMLSETDKQSLYIVSKGNKDDVTFQDMERNVETLAKNVSAARGQLYAKDLKIGQMVGPNGTMYVTDIEGDKAKAVEYVSGFASRIYGVLNDKALRKALGETAYRRHNSLLKEMLKGCFK